MYVWLYVCMYVCMYHYVCMYVCMCVYVYICMFYVWTRTWLIVGTLKQWLGLVLLLWQHYGDQKQKNIIYIVGT